YYNHIDSDTAEYILRELQKRQKALAKAIQVVKCGKKAVDRRGRDVRNGESIELEIDEETGGIQRTVVLSDKAFLRMQRREYASFDHKQLAMEADERRKRWPYDEVL